MPQTAQRVALSLLLVVLLAACESAPLRPEYGRPLPPGAPALLKLGPDEPRPDWSVDFTRRASLATATERSIEWMGKPSSRTHFPIEGVTHERALASLLRFRELVTTAADAGQFAAAIEAEFDVYKSAGWDGRGGGVLFTGYCTPILDGALQPDAEHRYALYAQPPDLVKDAQGNTLGQQTAGGLRPYPARAEIDRQELLTGKGLELAWLRSPLDAFVAHVNGSAVIRLPDGSLHRLGYAAQNGRPYTSVRNALVADGQLSAERANLQGLRDWASRNPGRVQDYLDRNERYVFFLPIEGNPRGSLNVEVMAERSLATDKSLFPRGAVTFIETHSGQRGGRRFRQFLLDQDTGGAIRTAGRADIYVGVGPAAERLAGATEEEGQLYYLFLRESDRPTAKGPSIPSDPLRGA